ncbi:MAG: inner membrane protein YpjD [Gammaproteobacteria bacterium]|nr:MAG: inner membrane protein YpjD [Gammaproteobacteria bacterium]
MHALVLTLIATALYLAAAGILALPLLHRQAQPRALGLGLAALAVIGHFAVLVGAHRGGVDLHFFAALSLVGACVAALCLIVNLSRPVATLGVIVFPLAALLLGVDMFFAPATQPLPLEWQIKLHVIFALLGYSVLTLAALFAILLALQERALRARHFNGIVRALPPLTLTEALMFRLIGAGFVLLTLTLITGILFITNLFDQHLAHKTVLSIAAWLVFGALLFGRWRYGWRGRRAVQLTLAGMTLLLLAFFGSRFVLEVLLHRVP